MSPLPELDGPRTGLFFSALEGYSGNIALVTSTETLTYAELARRAQAVADQLTGARRLVLLAGRNSVDAIVAYLGALRAGHVVLLMADDSPGTIESMISAYDPDSVIVPGRGIGGLSLEHRHESPVHRLHPELALLLSTSGSTGSPKLVRLSYENLQSNADSIVEYLGIREQDRAITTLPLYYCYGLSVVHSHLRRGASLIVTDLSVTDAEFWKLFRGHGASSFAAVPYTFSLLDRIGFSEMELPSLRYVTQAGGRLEPESVRRLAELGRAKGWDLVVMYGQTEATARMAYLPPHLATVHPQAIGIPIPRGAFRLAPALDELAARDVGELVYTGPNVMLGYATNPADLAEGRAVHELHTGDLARVNEHGLYEIVGRASRFLKLFGLRIDLQQVEGMLAERGVSAAAAGSDTELVVAIEAPADPAAVRGWIRERYGLPHNAFRVSVVDRLPRLASGKPDYQAVLALVEAEPETETRPETGAEPVVRGTGTEHTIAAIYARHLGRQKVSSSDTFAVLGGDSMTYVAMSMELEKLIGPLPANWPTMSIHDLARKRKRRFGALDTSVLLRAVSIILVIGTHLKLFVLPGGAQLMLAVAAYNFARFHLVPTTDLGTRLRRIAQSIARIWLPSFFWIVGALLVFDVYSPVNLLMANYLIGTDNSRAEWHFWFLEVLIYYLVICAAVLSTPWGARLERRYPFALPASLMMSGPVMAFGFSLHSPTQYDPRTIVMLFWVFATGWAAARATKVWHRLVVSLTIVLTVPEFFLSRERTLVIIAGLLLLVWVKTVPSIRLVNIAVGTVASASLFIYVMHWQVFSRLEQRGMAGVSVLLACVVIGIAYSEAFRRIQNSSLLAHWRRRRSQDAAQALP